MQNVVPEEPLNTLEGFILVGGKSSRMGRDKSRLRLGENTFTERIAAAFTAIGASATLVGQAHQGSNLEFRRDVFTEWGALGGIHTALAACHKDWALIVACDLPFVSPALFRRLAELRPGFEAVAPVQADGYLQPLCALYRVDPCLNQAEQLIKARERRPVKLLEAVRSRLILFEELNDLDGAEHFFDNINTPEDYLKAAAKGGDVLAKG